MNGSATLAMVAGGFGAMGAVTGKLAFGRFSFSDEPQFFIAALVSFILANVMMWWAYSQSLSRSKSTMQSLILNMGTNFVISGLVGTFFFEERHSVVWWLGLSLVISGVSILISSEKQKEE